MNYLEIILVGISLSMDAMAVAICQGMAMPKRNMKQSFTIALFFGLFQSLMPILGYLIGSHINDILLSINEVIAFCLLCIIGIKMIIEALNKKNSCENKCSQLNLKALTLLSIATSIDALAIGISFAMLPTNILLSASLIGIITFVISFFSVLAGYGFKGSMKGYSEMLGGVVLVLIGFKILLF